MQCPPATLSRHLAEPPHDQIAREAAACGDVKRRDKSQRAQTGLRCELSKVSGLAGAGEGEVRGSIGAEADDSKGA